MMPAPRLIIKKEILENMINKGYNQKEMMKELNIARETLVKLLKENGLEIKGKPDELIGKVFGKLTVIERLENTKDRRRLYRCSCECGNITEVKARYLNNGDTRSCGCYKKNFDAYKVKNYKNALERVGEKHGRLTIIDIAMRDNKKAYDMVCRCECGTICRKKYSQILKGEIVSCGCYAKEIASIKATTVLLKSRKNKKEWYFIKDNEKVYCRSGYEVIYANYLICNNIKFEYEPITFKIDNKRRYTPDFYLKDEDRYVELKGMPYDVKDSSNQREKIEILRKDYIIDIYYWKEIHNICELSYKHYTYYKIKADRLGVRVEDFLGQMMYIK
ncbi:MAG: hypothetical protein E6371_12895 [Terrisporobacter othiniensis]|uniref:hypothetical protein n=1 Tax=Terrisporobacter othiniensis TaxID=1577792 RepID=UPI00290E3965|nr:hypothetical protein [Terrisporobacter othiniensis]MDU6985305.1 hypothetical protein [Terrisporobacter othiniensis]